MKKIVLTAVAVGLAAVAAQAQGTGDGGVTRAVWGKAYQVNHADANTKKQTDTLARTLAKKVEEENFRRAQAAAQAQEQAKPQTKHYNHLPATGAMRDWAVEGRLDEQATPATKPAAKPAAKKKKAKAACLLARAFGFAKYENETEDEYLERMTQVAMSMK